MGNKAAKEKKQSDGTSSSSRRKAESTQTSALITQNFYGVGRIPGQRFHICNVEVSPCRRALFLVSQDARNTKVGYLQLFDLRALVINERKAAGVAGLPSLAEQQAAELQAAKEAADGATGDGPGGEQGEGAAGSGAGKKGAEDGGDLAGASCDPDKEEVYFEGHRVEQKEYGKHDPRISSSKALAVTTLARKEGCDPLLAPLRALAVDPLRDRLYVGCTRLSALLVFSLSRCLTFHHQAAHRHSLDDPLFDEKTFFLLQQQQQQREEGGGEGTEGTTANERRRGKRRGKRRRRVGTNREQKEKTGNSSEAEDQREEDDDDEEEEEEDNDDGDEKNFQLFTMGGKTEEDKLYSLFAIAVEPQQGSVIVSDCFNHRVVIFTVEGTVARVLKGGGGTLGHLVHPLGLALLQEPRGRHMLLVADSGNFRLCQLSVSAGEATTIMAAAQQPHLPSVLRFDQHHNLLFVLAGRQCHMLPWLGDLSSSSVFLLDPGGGTGGTGGTGGEGGAGGAGGLAPVAAPWRVIRWSNNVPQDVCWDAATSILFCAVAGGLEVWRLESAVLSLEYWCWIAIHRHRLDTQLLPPGLQDRQSRFPVM